MSISKEDEENTFVSPHSSRKPPLNTNKLQKQELLSRLQQVTETVVLTMRDVGCSSKKKKSPSKKDESSCEKYVSATFEKNHQNFRQVFFSV